LQNDREAERERLNSYRSRLVDLVQQHAQAESSPPKPLTIPAIFGRSYNEKFISNYLAYILDPAKNGIGEAPLAQLLQICELDTADLSLTDVTIHREYPLEDGRIDLLLEWEDRLILGIENKIFSAEGPGQTKYYARQIPKLFEGTPQHLLYLTRGGQMADSKQFQSVSYKQLLAALKNISLTADTGVRQRVIWDDFLEHLEVYIIMSDPDHFEFSEKSQLYIEHLAMFHDLENVFKTEWGRAIDYIEQQLYSNLEGGPWKTNFNRTRYTYHQVFKPTWESPGLWVHYEYWLTVKSLKEGKIQFMVDVERKQKDEFLARFDQRSLSLKTEYQQRDIQYRPPKRKDAIAWKTFPIAPDIDQVAQTFIDAFAVFRFLEKEIDDVWTAWTLKENGGSLTRVNPT
jgi:hypothetical protein